MKIALPVVTPERIAHTFHRMHNEEKPAPLTPKGAAPRCHPRPIAEVVCYSSAPTSRKNISAPSAGFNGAYFHGQFGDAFHSEGWTHGCLSYGRDTTMIDYMAS